MAENYSPEDKFPWKLSREEYRRINHMELEEFDRLPAATQDAFRHDAREHEHRRAASAAGPMHVIQDKGVVGHVQGQPVHDLPDGMFGDGKL